MKKHIEFDLPVLPGSISTAKSRCGKPGCVCKERSPRLHGIYYRWTGFIGGKRTTITISKAVAQECRKRIERFRKLQKVIEALTRKAVAHAPWAVNSKRNRVTRLKK